MEGGIGGTLMPEKAFRTALSRSEIRYLHFGAQPLVLGVGYCELRSGARLCEAGDGEDLTPKRRTLFPGAPAPA